MKFIYNKILPFGNFGLLNILGIVFTKIEEAKITLSSKVHEYIHSLQQWELVVISAMLSIALCNIYASLWYLLALPIIPFVLYAIAFLIELAIPPYHNVAEIFRSGKILKGIRQIWMDAYRDNCFEREAYANQANIKYILTRTPLAWIGYILKRKERR